MGSLKLGTLTVRVSAHARPARGEARCGDVAGSWTEGDALWFALLDAAGHGDDAATAAERGLALLRTPGAASPVHRLGAHQGASLGRPVAVALGRLGSEAPEVELALVGNIRLQVLSGPSAPSTHEGQPGMWAGHFPRLRPLRLTLQPGQRVLLHSDGLAGAARLDALPAGMSPRPLLVALDERWGRPHDDLSCLLLDIFDGNRWPFAD